MNSYFTLDETVNFVSYSFNVTFILFSFVSVDILTNKVYIYYISAGIGIFVTNHNTTSGGRSILCATIRQP